MNRPSFLCLVAVLALSSACSHKPKPNPAIATEMEEAFKQRWIAKRINELTQSGVTDPREARRQATEEFKQRYEFTHAAQKADPVNGGALP
jgi:1,2-phenylacetyl-CoA epoxidase catalytic subunit